MTGLEWLKHIFCVDDDARPAPSRRQKSYRRGARCADCGAFVPYSEAIVVVREDHKGRREKRHICRGHWKTISGPSEKRVKRDRAIRNAVLAAKA